MRDDDAPTGICQVGGHPHDTVAALCTHHLDAARAHLAELPRLVRSLSHLLVPGPAIPGEKVSTTRVGSPTPARLDVLTLVGPGCTEIRRDRRSLAPQVRRWSTVETVTVSVARGRGRPPEQERRQIRVWHRELVVDYAGRPLLVADDDQVGVVPPAEWADLWVRRWRHNLGHPVPERGRVGGWGRRWRKQGDPKAGTRPGGAPVALPALDRVAQERAAQLAQVAESADARLADAAAREALLMRHGQPLVLPAVAAYLTLKATYRAARDRVGAAVLGIGGDGPTAQARAGAAVTGQRVDRQPTDVVAAQWALRYGGATTAAHVEVDAAYLAEWLPYAAARDNPDDVGVGEFCVELRALVAELEHTLGETRDDHWLGRCPNLLVDGDGETTGRVCGYGLWQDPYRSRVECPRCHAAWSEHEWLRLAAQIRAKWPIDQRRLYTLGDRVAAERHTERLPQCRGCERTMAVEWREIRGRGYRESMYRPVGWACPGGCIAGGTQVAA
ncbi:hypothetical protein AB0A95_30475 [Micromonospora sp. NPDC049230]|uniref:hypothetical protein n=1 Tax=Micromonospora sp. NPDC049230 TaxID=3155502 RepID=UPI0033C4F82E